VVQETTSTPGDGGGSANPTRSKVRQETFEGCPPESPGRPLEACGNARPRWMVATRAGGFAVRGQNPAYRSARPLHPDDASGTVARLRESVPLVRSGEATESGSSDPFRVPNGWDGTRSGWSDQRDPRRCPWRSERFLHRATPLKPLPSASRRACWRSASSPCRTTTLLTRGRSPLRPRSAPRSASTTGPSRVHPLPASAARASRVLPSCCPSPRSCCCRWVSRHKPKWRRGGPSAGRVP